MVSKEKVWKLGVEVFCRITQAVFGEQVCIQQKGKVIA